MDTLAGYGSDDSSVVSSSQPTKGEPPLATSMSELLGDVSDASVEETNIMERPTVGGESKLPPTKKAKMDAIITTTINDNLLPEPALSKGENDSWICWKINYLQRPTSSDNEDRLLLTLDDVPSARELQENLQRLGPMNNNDTENKNTTSSSWADYLRSQHEFHNPHFFAAVVEHFGIQEPLGSAIGL